MIQTGHLWFFQLAVCFWVLELPLLWLFLGIETASFQGAEKARKRDLLCSWNPENLSFRDFLKCHKTHFLGKFAKPLILDLHQSRTQTSNLSLEDGSMYPCLFILGYMNSIPGIPTNTQHYTIWKLSPYLREGSCSNKTKANKGHCPTFRAGHF